MLLRGHYRRSWLRGDLVAGAAVTCYLVPQAVAYAAVAGLPAAVGLGTAIVAAVGYALLGSARSTAVGPESTLVPLIGATVAPMAQGDPARAVALAATLSLVVAGWCLLARFTGIGALAELLSWPVRVGYLAGAAVLMTVSQLGPLTGTPVSGIDVPSRLLSFATNLPDVRPEPVIVGAITLTLLFVLEAVVPRLPVAVVTLSVVAAGCAAFGAVRHGVAVIGPVAWSPPVPHLPAVSTHDVQVLLFVGLGIAAISFGNDMMISRTAGAGAPGSPEPDPRRELVALAGVHTAIGLTGGFPVSASNARTAAAVTAGANTQLHALVTAVLVTGLVIFQAPMLGMLPRAATGALVVYAAIRLVAWREFLRLARFRRGEMVLALTTTAGTFWFGMIVGVAGAVVLSFIQIAHRLSRPQHGVTARRPGRPGHHRVDEHPDACPLPGLVVYRFDAPLFFANVEDVTRGVLKAVDQANHRTPHDPVRWVILNAEAGAEIDITAADRLRALHAALAAQGVVLALARVKPGALALLERAGLAAVVGAHRIFPTLSVAEQEYQAWVTARAAQNMITAVGRRPAQHVSP